MVVKDEDKASFRHQKNNKKVQYEAEFNPSHYHLLS